MVNPSAILGLNARSQLFSYNYNKPLGKKIANSKLRTKKILKVTGISVPLAYAKFNRAQELLNFDWSSLPSSFALKPNKGLGGEGIIVVKKRAKDPTSSSGEASDAWITTQRKKVTIEDLNLHILNILEGAYSMRNVPDIAFFEEYVGRHKAFRKYAYRGTPDIRVIVFNKVPVMTMLRLPTKESGGRANLHQGAIAVGIDIVTGITTRAYWHGKYIRYKPGTKRKLNGIKIPNWKSILEIAVKCQVAIGLGYLGVDIVLHPEKGPMVLEVNYQPGLQIQLANRAGLKKRLERVEGLDVIDAEHGVRIAGALFSGPFSRRVKPDQEGDKTVNVFEKIKVRSNTGKKVLLEAKLDTGAWRTSIDKKFAHELGLLEDKNVLWAKTFWSALGIQRRSVIKLTFWLKGTKVTTSASVTDRKHLRKIIVIGRRDLKGFLVNPEQK